MLLGGLLVSSTYLLKYSLILSFERFSGRFPTQRCLVSLTMVETGHKPASWPPCPGTERPSLDDSHQTPAQPVISLQPITFSLVTENTVSLLSRDCGSVWLGSLSESHWVAATSSAPGRGCGPRSALSSAASRWHRLSPGQRKNKMEDSASERREVWPRSLWPGSVTETQSTGSQSPVPERGSVMRGAQTGLQLLTGSGYGWWLICMYNVFITFWNEECD